MGMSAFLFASSSSNPPGMVRFMAECKSCRLNLMSTMPSGSKTPPLGALSRVEFHLFRIYRTIDDHPRATA